MFTVDILKPNPTETCQGDLRYVVIDVGNKSVYAAFNSEVRAKDYLSKHMVDAKMWDISEQKFLYHIDETTDRKVRGGPGK